MLCMWAICFQLAAHVKQSPLKRIFLVAWIPIPGTKYFSEDGKGVYEKLGGKTSDGLYLSLIHI